MSTGTVVALGEEETVRGWGLAGVVVRPAADPDEVRAVWARLDPEVVLVILTERAAAALDDGRRRERLVAVLPR